MYITLEWLRHFINIDNINIIEVLNSIGIEVEGIYDLLITGQITSVAHIPKTQLYQCNVRTSLPEWISKTDFNILTKLSDVQEGTITTFTPAGYKTPSGMLIEKRSMFGTISEGMFHTTTDQIEIYDTCKVINATLKISIASNRRDLTSVYGICRDIAAKVYYMKNTEILNPLPYSANLQSTPIWVQNILSRFNMDLYTFIQQSIDYANIGQNELQGYLNYVGYDGKYEIKNMPARNAINVLYKTFYRISEISLSLQQMSAILERLEFKTRIIRVQSNVIMHDDFALEVIPPIWRFDIENDMDIIQEIIRIHGVSYAAVVLNTPYKPTMQIRSYNNTLRNILTSHGYTEMYNIPFTSHKSDVKIINPINATESYLRGTLLHGLLKSAETLLRHNEINAKLYEIGKIYSSEEHRIGILLLGTEHANIMSPRKQFTVHDLRYIISLLNLQYDGQIIVDKLVIATKEYTYYYYEASIQSNKPCNYFTNSMEKKYTNVNLESNEPIDWSVIRLHLQGYEYRLISDGFYREKYRMTFTLGYINDEHTIIQKSLGQLPNIIVS